MGENRLIEITSTVKELEGPLATMAYITSLSESDIYLFLKCIKNSKFRDMNLVNAVFAFADDYLRSKNIVTSDDLNQSVDSSDYVERLFSDNLSGHAKK